MKGFVNGYYRISLWVSLFAYLNLLWVVFSIAGVGVFGFMPATAAMFAVIRKWIMKEEVAVFKTFWGYFKKDFVKVNILGYIIIAVGYLLYIEFRILWSSGETIYLIASFGVFALFILYTIVLVYFFPIFSHFELKKVNYFKWPFIIGIVHPILTIFLIITLSVLYYMTFITIPALLFFFGGSVTAYILTWGAFKTFPKYEKVEGRTI
ncbi:membrane protein [Oceanobacillus picturae]|uniref:Membrane protein n=1 Tax=Oceanobacillus picturae TaxID=171693 RepID=A0A0U9HD71_9BACI|nr:DUF624 domain-containing protein [Oceanobacillus picturae]RIU94847.1 DUF624 domain-containing protein [Oceanobacillus picturae]GAQ16940.1 membrane protein [Oceanobacillus picturae]